MNNGIIDCHVHLGKWLKGSFMNLETTVEGINKTYRDFEGICVMPTDERGNVETRYKLSELTTKYKFIAWYNQDINDIISSIPDGLKFHPGFMNTKVTEDCYLEGLEFARQQKIPIFIHTGTSPNSWHIHAIELAQKNPDIIFILCHLGGERYTNHIDIAVDSRNVSNIYLDLTGRYEYSVKQTLDLFPIDRIIWGSDYPVFVPETGVATMMKYLNPEQFKLIMSDNIKQLFGSW